MHVVTSVEQALDLVKKKLEEMNNPPIYWVGGRVEDAFALNALLPYPVDYSIGLEYGSSTRYLEHSTKVLSLEKETHARINGRFRMVSEFFDEKNPNPLINLENIRGGLLFSYQPDLRIETFCYNRNIKRLSPPSFMRAVENKSYLRTMSKYLQINVPNHYMGILRKTSYEDAESILGNNGKYIIQVVDGTGGVGTEIVSSSKDFKQVQNQIDPNAEVVISCFIDGPSSATTGCITPHGLPFLSGYQQIIGNPETSQNPFRYSGNSFLSPAPKWCGFKDSVVRFCDMLRQQGYLGTICFDGINENVIDVGPRCSGTVRIMTELQLVSGQLPFLLMHLMHYLGIQFRLNGTMVDRFEQHLPGSFIILHPLETKPVIVANNVRPGVYRYTNEGKKVTWVKEGYRWNDFADDQILLTGGVVMRGHSVAPDSRLTQIWIKREVNDSETGRLNKFGKNIANTVYKLFEFEY